MTRVTALLTVHNRRELTLRCLRCLAEQSGSAELAVVLVDDGSTDGTSEAVQSEFPDVVVVAGTGELYWSRGMAVAWRVAAADDPDYYLLVNDDVAVAPDALERILRLADQQAPTVIVGAMSDPSSGVTTYSGQRLTSVWNPMAFERLEPPSTEPVSVDLFNGNFVLVPRSVYRIVGTVDPVYRHGIGDFDYARRASKAGVELVLAPGHFGTCPLNAPMEHTFREYVTSFKSHRYPPDWVRFCWRHGNWWALPVAILGPYLKAAFRALRGRPIVTT